MMRLGFMLLVAVWLSACASAMSSGYGQGGQDASGRSYAEARADNQITADVTAALVRDPLVPATKIDVKTYNGVVTLSGSVPSSKAAKRAEHLAAATNKVKRVENRLRVR